MIPIRVEPIFDDHAERIRTRRADEHGNESLAPQLAEPDSGLPCRVCLTDAKGGEPLLLFSYAPISRPRPYRFVGPVFIHADRCAPYADVSQLPPLLEQRLLSVRAFDRDDALLEAEVVEGRSLEAHVQRLLANSKVDSIHVHTARQGCYLCRIVRG